MTLHLDALSVAALDPARLAQFWSGVLGWERDGDHALLPTDDTGFRIRFRPTTTAKTEALQVHLDLTSTSRADQQATVARALDLGGRHLDVGQGPDADHVVLADPEGNEFCVIEPGNRFLADCGFLGALAGDGTQEVGYFWARALGWPLVWDQDSETAIRSPHGGPKITWGGPTVRAKTGPNRLHLELVPDPDSDQQTEVDRLVGLGATILDRGRGVLADPDGNELCVLSSR